jgi:hypothetical protein
MAEGADLAGWQSTRWGMLADEVIQVAGADRVQRTERQRYLRFYSDLKIPNLQLGQLSFDAIFQMDEQSDRLRQVLVLHQCDPSRQPTEEASTTRTVLEERFGEPQQAGPRETLVWVFPTTTIALESFYIAGSMSAVGVRFFPTGDDPAVAPQPSNASAEPAPAGTSPASG